MRQVPRSAASAGAHPTQPTSTQPISAHPTSAFRTALQPRWLGLLGLVVLVMVTFGKLGAWQLNVAQHKGQAAAAAAVPHLPVAPVTAVLAPQDPFPRDGMGRRVTATGRYDAAGQVLVTPRDVGSVTGRWVVTPLVVTSSGARLAVVRGFVPDADPVRRPPTGTVTVSGALEASESPSSAAGVDNLPRGELASVDLAALVNRWPGAVYNAFVVAQDERAAGGNTPQGAFVEGAMTRVTPPPVSGGGIAWRNAAYAGQWWIFAAFALYMWVKMVREESQRGAAGSRPPHTREAVRV